MLDREWIQERRRHLGLTHQDLAEMAGVSESSVRRAESEAEAGRKIAETLEKASEGWVEFEEEAQ